MSLEFRLFCSFIIASIGIIGLYVESTVGKGIHWIIDVILHTLTIIGTLSTLWLAFTKIKLLIEDLITNEFKEIRIDLTNLQSSFSNLWNNVTDIISSAKAKDRSAAESDVIRKMLALQVGEPVSSLLIPSDKSFPISLVPCGDIALLMSQEGYSEYLRELLVALEEWNVRWTTFTPFELLNRALALKGDYTKRIESDPYNPPRDLACHTRNETYGKYLTVWNKLSESKQVIVLSDPEEESTHPLSWDKYRWTVDENERKKIGHCNLEIVKYLYLRKDENNKGVAKIKEWEFLYNPDIRKKVLASDNSDKNIKWISLSTARKEIAELPIKNKDLYNLDFACFSNTQEIGFCLIRVDPVNYLNEIDGVMGVTFIVPPSNNMLQYSNLFNKLFQKGENTFKDLTGKDLV